jgi:beta-barrel assembly-enhancing protease
MTAPKVTVLPVAIPKRAHPRSIPRSVLRKSVPKCTVLLLLCAGVSTVAINLVSVEQEIEIGRQANAQMQKQMAELRDAEVSEYVRGIGRRLVAAAPGPKYPYSFRVANYREVNAFALPGGPIWVHRGVLQTATNESQVASVIAHEVAHIAQRHAAHQLTSSIITNLGLGLFSALLGNTGGADTARAAAGLLADGAFLKFSRDDEREADLVGLQMMARAGWDGRGMVELFETLRREARRDPGTLEVYFSSHPAPQDRIKELQPQMARHTGGRRDSGQFQAVKARLLQLPAARRMP